MKHAQTKCLAEWHHQENGSPSFEDTPRSRNLLCQSDDDDVTSWSVGSLMAIHRWTPRMTIPMAGNPTAASHQTDHSHIRLFQRSYATSLQPILYNTYICSAYHDKYLRPPAPIAAVYLNLVICITSVLYSTDLGLCVFLDPKTYAGKLKPRTARLQSCVIYV